MKTRILNRLLAEDLLMESGYGRVLNIKYDDYDNDPNPRILYFGKWLNPNTKNVLIGGVNLNYLNDKDIESLRKNLSAILGSGKSLKARWQKAHELLPHIFPGSGFQKGAGAYRTYKDNMTHIISTGTITPLRDKTAPAGPAKKKIKPDKTPQQTLNKAKELAAKPEPTIPSEPVVDKIKPSKPARTSKKHEPKPKLKPQKKTEPKIPKMPARTSKIQTNDIPTPEPAIEPELEKEPISPSPEQDLEIKPEDIPMPGPADIDQEDIDLDDLDLGLEEEL